MNFQTFMYSRDGKRCAKGKSVSVLTDFFNRFRIVPIFILVFCRDIVYDGDGNPLEDNPIDCVDMDTRRKISDARNKLEDIIRHAKNSSGGLDLLNSGLRDLESVVSQSALAIAHSSQEEQESFVGSSFPTQVDILTPTNINARGTCSRIKGHRDKEKKPAPKKLGVTMRVPRICGTCKELVLHDSRKCPKKK